MEYSSIDRTTAQARGFAGPAEMHAYFERHGYPGQKRAKKGMSEAERHAYDLEIARKHQAEMRDEAQAPAHAPTLRSDILAAELRTARTKAERRDAVRRFEAAQRTPDEARFVSWLASMGHETRAMGESGSAIVPTRFYQSVIHYAKEYSAFLSAFEPWESEHGEAYNRSAYSQFNAAATQTENATFTDGPAPVYAQQAWPQAPTYAGSATLSNQLVQDAFRLANAQTAGGDWALPRMGELPGGAATSTGVAGMAPFASINAHPALDALIASSLGESLGRAIAPVAQSALYAAINAVGVSSGGNGGYVALGAAGAVTFASGATTELAANTISLDTAAMMTEALDEAYQDNAAWYFSRTQWAGILRQQDAQKHAVVVPNGPRTLYGFPVVLTSQTSNATASTVAGPVFGDLGAAMTLRTVTGSLGVMRSTERYAEYLQTFFRAWLRGDVMARDARAVVGVKYAAS